MVVLVTHEVELARFYASRIIELKDGKITADYENKTADNLDYRLDNKFYLKDFEKHDRPNANQSTSISTAERMTKSIWI